MKRVGWRGGVEWSERGGLRRPGLSWVRSPASADGCLHDSDACLLMFAASVLPSPPLRNSKGNRS